LLASLFLIWEFFVTRTLTLTLLLAQFEAIGANTIVSEEQQGSDVAQRIVELKQNIDLSKQYYVLSIQCLNKLQTCDHRLGDAIFKLDEAYKALDKCEAVCKALDKCEEAYEAPDESLNPKRESEVHELKEKIQNALENIQKIQVCVLRVQNNELEKKKRVCMKQSITAKTDK
jgi:hypothetical protein